MLRFSVGEEMNHDVEDDQDQEDGDSAQLTIPSQSLFVDLCVYMLGQLCSFYVKIRTFYFIQVYCLLFRNAYTENIAELKLI